MELTVRACRPADFDAVAAIYDSAKLDEFRFEPAAFTLLPLKEDAERLAAFARCDVLVCECDGIVAGFAASADNTLRALFIAPYAVRRGIGRLLLQNVLARLEGDIRLSVAASNQPAQALYRSAGFAVTGSVETSYNGVRVRYATMLHSRSDRHASA